jgi:hypothetical protein
MEKHYLLLLLPSHGLNTHLFDRSALHAILFSDQLCTSQNYTYIHIKLRNVNWMSKRNMHLNVDRWMDKPLRETAHLLSS